MRAWTIVLFVIAIHACLFMFNGVNFENGLGYNFSIDTSSKSGNIIIIPGDPANISMPSPDSHFFDSSANGSNVNVNGTVFSKNDVDGGLLEQVYGLGKTLMKIVGMFGAAIFSIHTLAAPYFGDSTAWILEGMVDIVFGIALFQLVTGRSFKTID
jgi:PPE-repeat protein